MMCVKIVALNYLRLIDQTLMIGQIPGRLNLFVPVTERTASSRSPDEDASVPNQG